MTATRPAPPRGTGDRGVATVPNVLSLLRLALLGLYLGLLFGPDDRVAAALVLGGAGVTDFLDGYVARRFDQVSTVGKVLDPTVDRVVVGTAVVSAVVYGAVPAWVAALVLAREALVSSAVLLLAARGARRIDVIWLGKAGTFGMMVCLPLLVGAHGPGGWTRPLAVATWVVFVPSFLASLSAALAYLPRARAALEDARGAGAGTGSDPGHASPMPERKGAPR